MCNHTFKRTPRGVLIILWFHLMVIGNHWYNKLFALFVLPIYCILIFFYKFILVRFYPCKIASNGITMTIRQQYTKSWPTWNSLTNEEKERSFQPFKVSFHIFNTITFFIVVFWNCFCKSLYIEHLLSKIFMIALEKSQSKCLMKFGTQY